MAKTKEDYRIAGRNDYHRHLRGEALECTMFTTKTESWQSRSYYEGWETEEERLNFKKHQRDVLQAFASAAELPVAVLQPPTFDPRKIVKVKANLQPTGVFYKGSGNMLQPIPPEEMPQTGMQGWPAGAAEHAARLKAELSKELRAKRAARLLASLKRLYAKHDARAQQ